MAIKLALLAIVLCSTSVGATNQQEALNPIRKVVTMLQSMQTKVTEEGEAEKKLYDKFMCYCKGSGGDLSKSISDAETAIPQLGSDIKEAEEKKASLEEDVKQHKADREAAKQAMGEATAIREKEAAAFAKEKGDSDANIDALLKAIAALEKGMAGAFLQTEGAKIVRKLVVSNEDMNDADRQDVMSFLSADEGYAPQSGEIVGILKQMGDEMAKGLAEATAAENAAIAAYDALMAAKKKEVEVLTKSIETKLVRISELAVSIAEMKNSLSDTEQALLEDQKFFADLEKSCAAKTAEWEERSKTRAEELVALADTIKVLNDDDALELFKKTLPSASASFVQLKVNSQTVRARALTAIHDFVGRRHPGMDFIALALHGKKIGFDKVFKMIDEMVATLKQEQIDDDHKKESCTVELDSSDDKKKALEHELSDLETMVADTKESLASLSSEIEGLSDSIKALDKSVAAATETRKEEHEEYVELLASDSAAKELLAFARNRLNKFYNPKLYTPPPKRVITAEDRGVLQAGGTLAPTAAPGGIADTGVVVLADVSLHDQNKVAPPPPPETWGAYSKKSGESTGVIAMIDLLVKDLDKEMTEAETEEKDAQEDYEAMMKDSADQRMDLSKSLADKEGAKAEAEAALTAHEESKTATENELKATLKYIESLHMDCDWLLKFFDMRAEARASEISALGKAKAVLSGADYSLLQTKGNHKLLRGA